MSMVDINASLDSYVELAGTVDEYGECLQMEEILNIYAWDEIQGEDVLVENVDKVYIDDTSLYSMEEYAGRNVMVGGDLWFESGTAYYRVTTIINIRLSLMTVRGKKRYTGVRNRAVIWQESVQLKNISI